MSDHEEPRVQERWARLRFAVVGELLAAPPPRGELRDELERLAAKTWTHPTSGEPLRFGLSTIERWYYSARRSRDPVAALCRPVRQDAGTQPSLTEVVRQAVRAQHGEHPGWSVQLHYDNLLARGRSSESELGELPSYSTLRRFMKVSGLSRRRRPRATPGAARAERRRQALETRSYEAAHVHGLWHADFHHARRSVLLADGGWRTPILLAFVDDHSRLCCHLQWYLDEGASSFVHGLCQAIEKRGLPRALMTDNGAAMRAAETTEGLARLGITHQLTLPYSPNQNAKQEILWASVEGRLMAMLEGVDDLRLDALQEATQAWAEMEYHRRVHAEIGQTPLERYLGAPHLGRPSPSGPELEAAFRAQCARTQRKSDGTLSLLGRRFEIPSRYRHLERMHVRYASWDLSRVDLIDPRTGVVLGPLYPVDKVRNADGRRRALTPLSADDATATATTTAAPRSGMAPLLRELVADYAASGLPPAYLPKNEKEQDQ